MIRLATATGLDEHAWKIARAAWAFFYERNYLDDLLTAHRLGLESAIRICDEYAAATMHNYLASGYFRTGDVTLAIENLQATISIRDSLHDKQGALAARMNLANVLNLCGEFREAATLHEEVLTARQRAGDVSAIGTALSNLGNVYTALGRYQDALNCHRRCLAVSREAGNLLSMARSLGNLGLVRLRLGDVRAASRLLIAALQLRRRMGGRDAEGEIMNDLATAHRMLGNHQAAITKHVDALALIVPAGDRPVECMTRNAYGQTLLQTGDVVRALEQHRTALAMASKIRMKHEQARALDGIASCLQDSDPDEARRHWQQALALYTEMGTPERHEVARNLAALSTDHRS